MREIKFRAWNTKINQMWFGFFIMAENGVVWLDREDGDGMQECSQDDFILMQYTSLKDKNGKEIYEGDILQSEFPVQEFNGNARHTVEWMAENVNGWSFKPSLIDNYEMEVIGNIYENKSLLKEKEKK